MAGRFPLYTDADVHGPIIDGLRHRGWDIVRAIEEYPEGTPDSIHFETAARMNRVLVAVDTDQENIAGEWLAEQRPFRGFITYPGEAAARYRVGVFLAAFDELVAQENPFAYPIVHLRLRG